MVSGQSPFGQKNRPKIDQTIQAWTQISTK